MCKENIFGGNIYVRSRFSCVCLSHELCACTPAQLRGNIACNPDAQVKSNDLNLLFKLMCFI